MNETRGAVPVPVINVTPLIDVLLVLLIIFMRQPHWPPARRSEVTRINAEKRESFLIRVYL